MVPETPAVQMASQIGSSRFRISEPYAERLHKIAMLGSGFSCHPACDKWETHPSRSPRRVTPRETRLCNHPSTVNNKRRPSRLERLVFPTHSLFKFKFSNIKTKRTLDVLFVHLCSGCWFCVDFPCDQPLGSLAQSHVPLLLVALHLPHPKTPASGSVSFPAIPVSTSGFCIELPKPCTCFPVQHGPTPHRYRWVQSATALLCRASSSTICPRYRWIQPTGRLWRGQESVLASDVKLLEAIGLEVLKFGVPRMQVGKGPSQMIVFPP